MSLILPGQKDPEKKEKKTMKIGEWFWNEITKARPGKGRDEIMNEWSWQLDEVDRCLPDNPDVLDRLVGHDGDDEYFTFRQSQDWDIAWDDMMDRFEQDEWDSDGSIAAAMAWWKRWCLKHGWVIDVTNTWRHGTSTGSWKGYDFRAKGRYYDFNRPNFDDEKEDA